MTFSNQDTELLIEKLPEALFLEDLEGNILDVNQEACETLGYSKRELVELNVNDLAPQGAPAFLPDEIKQKTETTDSLETTNIRKDGTEVPVELKGTIIETNEDKRLLVSIRDITQRKTAKEKFKERAEKYRTIFESAQDAIFIMKDDKFIDCNKKTEEIFCCSRDEIIGEPPYKFSPKRQPDGRISKEKSLEKINAALNGEAQFFEWTHTTKAGEPFPAIITLNRYEIDNDEFLMAIVRDITERKRTEERLEQSERKLRNLHEMVDELQHQDTVGGLLNTAIDFAERVLEFNICAISLLEGNKLVPKANSTDIDPSDTKTFKVGEGISGRTVEKGEAIWGGDVRNYLEAKPTKDEFRSFISVPIGEIGCIQVISTEVDSFEINDVEFAKILAGHLSEEVLRMRLEKKLRKQAIKDPLTGLYNRRYFNETLKKEVEKAERYSKPLAFLMIDVNRFKEINDRFSHQTGDRVLKEVAEFLKENVRDSDTVVRYVETNF